MATPRALANILICEDHYVSAVGIETVLRKHSPHVLKIRTAYTGKMALSLAHQETPDLAVIDLLLPDISGIEVIREIRRNCPSTRLIVLTALDEPHVIRQACQLRADAVLRKTHTDYHFQEALQFVTARKGETYLDPSVQSILKTTENRALTPREYEVVGLMAQGLTSNEIAKCMDCTLATIKTYRARIMDKSGARNSAEIVAWYLKGNGKGNLGTGA